MVYVFSDLLKEQKIKEIILLKINDRTILTLRFYLSRSVAPNLIKYSNYRKGYTNLKEFGIKHFTINRLEYFKDINKYLDQYYRRCLGCSEEMMRRIDAKPEIL